MAILNPSKTPPTGTFVKSFNGRRDDVTLTLADVIAALGYTPTDGAGLATTAALNAGLASKVDAAGLNELIDDRIATLLVAGTNVTLTYDDAANTLTINSTGVSVDNSNSFDFSNLANSQYLAMEDII